MARRWEESEWWEEQRWTAVTATLECIVDDVQELLDGLVPEEKEKGVEMDMEEMEMEEMEMEEMEMEEMEMEEMGEAEEAEELGETGAGVEKDGDGEMEVEETLKETEKSVDEAVMED